MQETCFESISARTTILFIPSCCKFLWFRKLACRKMEGKLLKRLQFAVFSSCLRPRRIEWPIAAPLLPKDWQPWLFMPFLEQGMGSGVVFLLFYFIGFFLVVASHFCSFVVELLPQTVGSNSCWILRTLEPMCFLQMSTILTMRMPWQRPCLS
jgi:hypothetical protein